MATPRHESAPAVEDGGNVGRAGITLSAIINPTADSEARGAPGGDLISRRRRWAYVLIRRAPSPPPTYGSVEWLALAEGSPEKVAGVVVAAEAYARAGDTLEEDLRREVENARAAFKSAEDADYQARAAEHRARYGKGGDVVSFAERRQRELDNARQPRPGDYPGRSVARRRGIDFEEAYRACPPEKMCDAGCGMSLVVDPGGCGDGCRAGNRVQGAS